LHNNYNESREVGKKQKNKKDLAVADDSSGDQRWQSTVVASGDGG